MKYSDYVADWLRALGYDTCFFVAGGNIMHLLESMRRSMKCIAVVHEVAAGIAVEAYNETRDATGGRAFALVTAGPGMTNIVTAIAGAYLESRELLVIGGTVKSSDLSRGEVRQRGIQEIDGVAIAAPICKLAKLIVAPVTREEFVADVELGRTGRRGPVFLEMCLDAQAAPVPELAPIATIAPAPLVAPAALASALDAAPAVAARVRAAARPVVLLGAGISRACAERCRVALEEASVAVMTSWNAMDRVDAAAPNYFGRPNQWGQRRANVLIQQADVIVALGTRLGLQQTGFNWQAFGEHAYIVQADIDQTELRKGHPRVDRPLVADADTLLEALLHEDLGDHREWLDHARAVRALLPLRETANVTAPGYIDPFLFAAQLSEACAADDVVVPCSSGGAFTTMMQGFSQRFGQRVVTDKGLASMGYGLSAAIGAAFAHRTRRTVLVEGDGGFSQNVQELATVAVNGLNLKMFVFSNEGYASIRMTQRNYFGGEYIGCDTRTGLGFPDWLKLFEAYGIPSLALDTGGTGTAGFARLFEAPGPAAFVVPIDPEQTYFPKITSFVTATGSMQSAPLHLMTPELDAATTAAVAAPKGGQRVTTEGTAR